MKVTIKSKKEIALLREGGKILREALNQASELIKEAEKREFFAIELDNLVKKIIEKHGGKPSFLNFQIDKNLFFPGVLCVSVNNEVVHGLPTKEKMIKSGDLVTLDLGVEYKKLFTDAAVTVSIGKPNEQSEKLIITTKKCLATGLKELRAGATLGNYGFAVERVVKKQGFEVVKILGGHGVGYGVHEPPFIPNYGTPGTGLKLKKGMVLALEPIVNAGTDEVKMATDDFTFVTADGSLSAQFEHTVIITDNGCEVLA